MRARKRLRPSEAAPDDPLLCFPSTPHRGKHQAREGGAAARLACSHRHPIQPWANNLRRRGVEPMKGYALGKGIRQGTGRL